jgi:hypothetical protein
MTAYRQFTHSSGSVWRVYRVEPQSVSPTLARLRESMTGVGAERRRPWLLFESSAGERRRLAPVPERWDESCTDADLADWCEAAERIPPAPMRRDSDSRPGSDQNGSE